MNTKIIVFLMTAVVGLVLNTQAQILRGEPDKEGEVEKVRSAVVIVNQGLDVSKEELTFQGTYQQNETDMAFRSQARERGLCDFAKHYRTNVIVEPYVKIKKKKGFFVVTVKGYKTTSQVTRTGNASFNPGSTGNPNQKKKIVPKDKQPTGK